MRRNKGSALSLRGGTSSSSPGARVEGRTKHVSLWLFPLQGMKMEKRSNFMFSCPGSGDGGCNGVNQHSKWVPSFLCIPLPVAGGLTWINGGQMFHIGHPQLLLVIYVHTLQVTSPYLQEYKVVGASGASKHFTGVDRVSASLKITSSFMFWLGTFQPWSCTWFLWRVCTSHRTYPTCSPSILR